MNPFFVYIDVTYIGSPKKNEKGKVKAIGLVQRDHSRGGSTNACKSFSPSFCSSYTTLNFQAVLHLCCSVRLSLWPISCTHQSGSLPSSLGCLYFFVWGELLLSWWAVKGSYSYRTSSRWQWQHQNSEVGMLMVMFLAD